MATPNPNIWQLQASSDINGLTEALKNADAGTRKAAAAALRALTAWQAVPALQEALAAEQDGAAKAAIAAALEFLEREVSIRQMIEKKDISGLSKLLNSSNIDDIKAACAAFGATGDRHAAEPLIILFRNPLQPNSVRLAAAEALLKLESAPAVVTLLGALRRDNWQVRRNAAAVLGQLQAGWATEALIQALNDPHQAVQRTVAAALRRINSPEAIQAVNDFEEAQRKEGVGTQPIPPETVSLPTPVIPSVTQPTEAATAKTPISETQPIQATQPMKAVAASEPTTPAPEAPTTAVTPEPKPITGPLPKPRWMKEEPDPHLDDTRPSRPTQLKSPLKQEGASQAEPKSADPKTE